MAYQKKHTLFIDLETLGKWDDAIILSIGLSLLSDEQLKNPVLTYDDILLNTEEYKLDIFSQGELGRVHDPKVFEWWRTQGPDAKKVALPGPDDLDINLLFPKMEDFLSRKGTDWRYVRLFDRRGFDVKKLQHVWEVSLHKDDPVPWDYRELYEIATFLKFNSPEASTYGCVNPKEFNHSKFIYHSAGCDAALDAFRFHRTFVQGADFNG